MTLDNFDEALEECKTYNRLGGLDNSVFLDIAQTFDVDLEQLKKAFYSGDVASESWITVVYADDWTGLYDDGFLVMEGHSLPLLEVLEYIGETKKGAFKTQHVECSSEWLHDLGNLPNDLIQVARAT